MVHCANIFVTTESTAPENFTVTSITNTTASFQWLPPLDANSFITGYYIILSNYTTVIEKNVTNTTLEVMFSDLLPFVNYTATLFATNVLGNGTSTELFLETQTGSK